MIANAKPFKDCFICGEKLKTTFWYHNECGAGPYNSDLLSLIRQLDNIPECIPYNQQYRYMRRIYLGKELHETVN